MFIQVIFLSKICNVRTGDRLHTQTWNQTKPQASSICWPRTAIPSAQDLNLWRRALTVTFNLGCNQMLPLPLGLWLQQSNYISKWYYKQTDKTLWCHKIGEWLTYKPIPRCTRRSSFHNTGRVIQDHPQIAQLQIALVEEQGNQFSLLDGDPNCKHH